jgi:hypothetical protein
MELARILDQSQPRVSRHLKLMAEAGLIERFPDGAWVFYRLPASGPARHLADAVLDLLEDAAADRDDAHLQEVRAERHAQAADYFERVAPQWDQIRSLYVSESAVEAAINGRPAGSVRTGDRSGHRLGADAVAAGRAANTAVGLDLSQQMLNVARANVSEGGLEQGRAAPRRHLRHPPARRRAPIWSWCIRSALPRRIRSPPWPRPRAWSSRAVGC